MTAYSTVIIPDYNVSDTIARTLQNCLAQSLSPSAVIVADDGLKQQTVAIVSGFGAAVRLIGQSNAGPGGAPNAAARVGRGKWPGGLTFRTEHPRPIAFAGRPVQLTVS